LAAKPDSELAAHLNVDDDEIVSWWGLTIEGYLASQDRLMGEIQQRCGLPPAQFDILLRLVRTPGNRMPMSQLAREAALSSGGFTKVADRLESAGLIKRVPSELDRRVTHATLTEAGRELASQARAVCAEILKERVLLPLGEERSRVLADIMRILRESNSHPE
jgi:DNA-binding MarR family transcriptional regulator